MVGSVLGRYAPADNRIEWHPADRVRIDVDKLEGLDFVRSPPVQRDDLSSPILP